MRIALNFATARGAGSSRVARGILDGLSALPASHEYLVFLPEAWGNSPTLDRRFTVERVRAGVLAKWIHETAEVPGRLLFGKYERLFSAQDTGPLLPLTPELLLVQQAYLAYAPSEWGFSVPARFALRMRVMAQYFRLGLPRVTQFTVQTEDMRSHLVQRWQIDPGKVHVIPSSIDLPARAEPSLPSASPYVIYVSASGPHKNYRVLADMLGALRRLAPGVRLKLTTREQEVPDFVERCRIWGVQSQVEFLGSMPREALTQQVLGACAAVIPSKLESFGLPYYEALALGVPVVAADRGFSREACGEAGLYAHADSGDEFAAHVARLVNSTETRKEYALRALNRYSKVHVPWTEVARRYLSLLEGLV